MPHRCIVSPVRGVHHSETLAPLVGGEGRSVGRPPPRRLVVWASLSLLASSSGRKGTNHELGQTARLGTPFFNVQPYFDLLPPLCLWAHPLFVP